MGKLNGPYIPEYPLGMEVRILSRELLESFQRRWRFHHPLEAFQLEYARVVASVKTIGFYRGGDELYELDGIPGIWHVDCLEPVKAG